MEMMTLHGKGQGETNGQTKYESKQPRADTTEAPERVADVERVEDIETNPSNASTPRQVNFILVIINRLQVILLTEAELGSLIQQDCCLFVFLDGSAHHFDSFLKVILWKENIFILNLSGENRGVSAATRQSQWPTTLCQVGGLSVESTCSPQSRVSSSRSLRTSL